jgi:hypothetical protein
MKNNSKKRKTHLLYPGKAARVDPPPLRLLGGGTLQKSTARRTDRCPPPRCLTVTCPVALRPPLRPAPPTSCLCGEPFQRFFREVMTRPRIPGVVGLYTLSPAAAAAREAAAFEEAARAKRRRELLPLPHPLLEEGEAKLRAAFLAFIVVVAADADADDDEEKKLDPKRASRRSGGACSVFLIRKESRSRERGEQDDAETPIKWKNFSRLFSSNSPLSFPSSYPLNQRVRRGAQARRRERRKVPEHRANLSDVRSLFRSSRRRRCRRRHASGFLGRQTSAALPSLPLCDAEEKSTGLVERCRYRDRERL